VVYLRRKSLAVEEAEAVAAAVATAAEEATEESCNNRWNDGGQMA
jgi:hypothetical protein